MIKQIREFKEKDSISQPLFLSHHTKGVTDKGASYLTLVFQDKSGTIQGKLWQSTADDEANIAKGGIFKVDGDIIEYKGVLQIRVRKVDRLQQEQFDLLQFVMKSQIPLEKLKEEINKAVNCIQNEVYSRIIKEMLLQFENELYEYPAAAKIHHSFYGGLAEHIYGMLRVANAICDLYPQLNRDLLVSGVLAHDLGKIIELTGALATEYTAEGKLIGHISIIQAIVYDIAKTLHLENTEEVMLLRHMVLSHHGKYEYGSPVLPSIPEAEVLCMIDNLDARLNTLKSVLEAVEPGQFSPKVFSLDNRSFYKSKK